MPAMLSADMEAINKYFMENVVVKTAAAEKIKQEWMKWWNDHRRNSAIPGPWNWYTQEEFDYARNERNRFNDANAVTKADKQAAVDQRSKGLTTEELRGETKRAGTSGMYVEPEKPLIPTSWKVGAAVGVGLITVGVFGKKLLGMTPLGKLAKFL